MHKKRNTMLHNFRNGYGIFSNHGANSQIEGILAYCVWTRGEKSRKGRDKLKKGLRSSFRGVRKGTKCHPLSSSSEDWNESTDDVYESRLRFSTLPNVYQYSDLSKPRFSASLMTLWSVPGFWVGCCEQTKGTKVANEFGQHNASQHESLIL